MNHAPFFFENDGVYIKHLSTLLGGHSVNIGFVSLFFTNEAIVNILLLILFVNK